MEEKIYKYKAVCYRCEAGYNSKGEEEPVIIIYPVEPTRCPFCGADDCEFKILESTEAGNP